MLIWRCVKLPQSWFVSHHKKMPFLALQESVILPKRFSLSEKKGHWMSVFPPSPRPVSWKICLSSFLYGFRGLTSLLNQFVFFHWNIVIPQSESLRHYCTKRSKKKAFWRLFQTITPSISRHFQNREVTKPEWHRGPVLSRSNDHGEVSAKGWCLSNSRK